MMFERDFCMKKLFFALLLATFIGNAFADDKLPDLKIEKLAYGVYLHTSYKVVDGYGLVDSNGLVVLDHKDAYILDTPWTAEDTEKLLAWIKAQGFTLKASLSTHFHEDRTAGIAVLNARHIPTYASAMTNRLLGKMGRAQASHTFDNGDFWLVKNRIEVFYPGPGHSRDNVVVWLPQQKILLGGCFVRSAESTDLGNVADADVSQWPQSAEKLKTRYRNVSLVIPGHGKIGDASLLEHTLELASAASAKPANP